MGEAVDEKPSDAEPKDQSSDDAAFDISIYTEDKLYKDITALIKSGVIDPETSSKKAIRKKLRKHYKLEAEGKPFKRHEPFAAAVQRIADGMNNGDGEDVDDDGDVDIDAPKDSKKSKSKKKKSKDKKKKRKTRKRKKPSSDHEDAEAADDDDAHADNEPSKKKRKMNSGEAVDADADGADADDEDEEEDADVDVGKKKAKKAKGKKERRKKKAPKYTKLDKLKQLLRATRQATPRVYAQLKELKNDSARVKMCLALLAEKDVPTNDMSARAIKKLQDDWALKREMAELGLGNAGDEQSLECEDGVPLSTRRPRRKRKEVSYLAPKLNLNTESNSGAEEDQGAEPEEEEEEESEEYQPPEMSDDE